MSDLDAIEVEAVGITVGGQTFTVGAITMDRMPAFARALRPILPAVAELAAISTESDPQYVADTLLALVSEDGESLIEAVAVAVSPDRDGIQAARARVGRLNPADFLLLALPIVKANADFFARRLLPALVQSMQAAKAIPGAGSIPSSA